MSLIKCPACPNKVSVKADKCMRCGYPFKPGEADMHWKKQLMGKLFVAFFGLILGAILIAILINSMPPSMTKFLTK